ncbi:S8 family serine peptidase [Aquiflexum sp. LQ15W]|uniref:S8 family serine peptidase n=1 Tax=Cognataquiflexum nitidum TaxID=2922272 RepID=UPI001F138156|nr:S8 family serine peptidase [Cognataquiflexum nitidum]MCH6198665.1 S8 family serine peptidase [Cognataquiflexum nitidum]
MRNWYVIQPLEKYNADLLVEKLMDCEKIIVAMVNRPLRLEFDAVPNDTNYGVQWHLNNPSQPQFDIRAQGAWDINKGRNDVIIAVLDGGVDYNHPDLDPGDRSRVIAGIDTGDGDNDPLDNLPISPDSYSGHGTKIAGVIGARTNNSLQVSGIMWNCKIMPIKMVRSGGVRIPHIVNWDWSTAAFPSDVAAALDYAVNNNTNVINLSYSFPDLGFPINEIALRIPLLAQAIDNAYRNNIVITASMGNAFQTNNGIRYPAGFDEQVIAVGATTQNGTKASFSNTGPHINLSAPGLQILTTDRGGGTASPSGTSFSAPIVAGAAGLVISHGKDRGFNLTNDDVRNILQLTANGDAGPIPGFDNDTGHGIVNAQAALQLINQPNTVVQKTLTGGTAVLHQAMSQWVLTSGRWGIAAGTYFQVDRYKITRHVTFDIPFCSVPKVWMRDRQSRSLSYANPNSGRPFSIISNISKEGFDVEYVTYYVRTNASGQTINKWIPEAPAQTQFAYTAVGQLNPAGSAGPISGADIACSASSYTIAGFPAGASVSWSASPSGIATISGSGQTITLSPVSNGQITLTAVITGSCGPAPSISKNIQVGPINSSQVSLIGQSAVCPANQYTYQAVVPGGHKPGYIYQWTYPSGWNVQSQSGPNITFYVPSNPNYGTVRFRVNNGCGFSEYSGITVFPGYNCSAFPYSVNVYPNPAIDQFKFEIQQPKNYRDFMERGAEEKFEVEFYDQNGNMVSSFETFKWEETLNLSKLGSGFYFLQIKYRNSVFKRQIEIAK